MTFQSGQSGNPAGRPRGIKDKRTELRALLEVHANEIINKLVEHAKQGDPTALKLCLERLVPKARPETGINFELPEGRIDTGDNMLQITNEITNAVAAGEMEVKDAQRFTAFLKQQEYHIMKAELKKKQEIDDEERKKYWAERYKQTSSEDS